MKPLLCVILALAPWTMTAVGLAQEPVISTVAPLAVAPGKATDLIVQGGNLTGLSAFWTSFSAKADLAPGVDKNGQLGDRVVYRLTLPADAQVGIGAVRCATGKGASSLMLVLVDDLPTAADNGNNHAAATAQEVALPMAIDGTVESLQADVYKVSGKKGQRVSIEVVAQRLGSQLDSVIRILDPAGKELTYSDDEAGIGADSRLAFTFPADGAFLVELRDIRYQGGGAAYRYRLRIGNFPIVTTPYPTGVQSSIAAEITAAGPVVEGVEATKLTAPADAHGGAMSVGVRFAGGQGSGFGSLVVSKVAELKETEPNDLPPSGTMLTLPSAVSGRFDKPKDKDFYRFEAKKGQRFTFTGRTRTLGSPSDLLMRLHRPDGGVLEEAEDNGMNEGAINHTFAADGVYTLAVEDLLRRGGPEYSYRVEIEPYRPGFSLAVETDKITAPKEGAFALKVTCARRDYNGPIELSLAGGGDGFVLAGQTIPAGKNETQLTVTLPSRLMPGTLLNVSIVGKAKVGNDVISDVASTLPGLKKLMPSMIYPPAWLDGLIGLGVGPEPPPFFALSTAPDRVSFPQGLTTATVRVKVNRIDKAFKTPIALAVENLPPGFAAEVKPVGTGEAEYIVTIKGPPTAAEGQHILRIIGTGTHNNLVRKITLPSVPLVIGKPLAVQLTPAGPLAPGGKQKVKITVTRFGDERSAVTIAWKKGPAGVLAPITLVVPSDKSEIETELAAAADAPLGTFSDLIAAATTMIQGQTLTAESPAATIEIKK